MKGSFCLTYEPEQQNNNIVRLDENIKQETMECHFFFNSQLKSVVASNQWELQNTDSWKNCDSILFYILFYLTKKKNM